MGICCVRLSCFAYRAARCTCFSRRIYLFLFDRLDSFIVHWSFIIISNEVIQLNRAIINEQEIDAFVAANTWQCRTQTYIDSFAKALR